MQQKLKAKNYKIGTFHLAMITVAFVASVRMLPMMAEYGLGVIVLFAVASVSFLFPTALVSAELAAAFPSKGGIYSWVKKALPDPCGFIAVWLQIVAVITMMPAYLSFDAATFAYSFSSDLASNKYFLIAFILVVYWTITLVSVFGMKTAGWLNSVGAFIGVFIPIIFILILGIVYFFSGNKMEVSFTPKSYIPDFNFTNLLFIAGLLFSLTGMEASGSHALEVKDVQKTYPKAMIISAFIIFFIGFGAVAIAMVVPKSHLSVLSGLMQAFKAFLDKFNLTWFLPILALMIACGSTVTLNSLIIGPAKSVLGTAKHGDIPPLLAKQNRFGMPDNLLFFLAVIVSLYTLLFIFMPDPDTSYCLLTGILSASYMIMYILLFVAAIVLRYKRPDVKRPFKVPGGIIGLWITCVLGILSALLGIVTSCFPPEQLHGMNYLKYELFLFGGILFVFLLGFFIYKLRRPEWVNNNIQ